MVLVWSADGGVMTARLSLLGWLRFVAVVILGVALCVVPRVVVARTPGVLPAGLGHLMARLRRDRDFRADWRLLAARYHNRGNPAFIVVDVARQRLYLFERGHRAESWVVSTALRGIGQRENSYKTPVGVFRIVRKIGAGLPPDAVLRYQAPTGAIATLVTAPDDPAASRLILSRILWLEGLQPGWNEGGDVDTYWRHIYIHGTANIGMLGSPASYGCVQLAPRAMIALYRRVAVGTLVLITPGTGDLRDIPGMGRQARTRRLA